MKPRPVWDIRHPTPTDDLVALRLTELELADDAARDAFLNPSLTALRAPSGLRDMEPAVEKLLWAVTWRQPIVIFGDYDCDGITSTVLLHDLFTRAGARVGWMIPDRSDGYGLSTAGVERVATQGGELILTVDNGISANEAIDAANERGLTVIVTDHHKQERELPDALAIINPNRRDCDYPFKGLAGVGVAYKLATALAEPLLGATRGAKFLREALDLVALGTVADMVPLIDENRALVAHGLSAVGASRRPGLHALLQSAGVGREPDATDIGFRLGPRINAAGRMGRAALGAELLLCDDEKRATVIAEELERLNSRRKRLSDEGVALAERELARQGYDEAPFLCVAHADFHPGIAGLAAGNLARTQYRPTLILRIDGDHAGGSARSIEGYDITAALGRQSALLTGYGGHPMAAGCGLRRDDIPALREALLADASERLTPEMLRPRLDITTLIDPDGLTLTTWERLKRLAPFGQGNPAPVLASLGAEVAYVRTMGRDGAHLQLTLREGPRAVGWGLGEFAETLSAGDRVDLAFTLERNRFRGVENLQLDLKDVRPAE